MANLQKFRAHEAENTQAAGGWAQQSRAEVDSSTDTFDVSGYHNIHLSTNLDLYFAFSNSTTDIISTTDSLILKGGDTIYSLRVPHGLGTTIILQLRRATGTNSLVRLIFS